MPPDRLERINAGNPYAKLIGYQFTRCENGQCACHVELRGDHHHGGGVVHGGIAFSLADSAMATGLMSLLDPGQFCATIELKISYLAPAVRGTLHCESRIVRRGKNIAFLEARVFQDETDIATAQATFAIVTPKPSA
jgi:acyl-CoA thioesterase